MDFQKLQQEIRQCLCIDYAKAFSSKVPARLMSIYKPNTVITFHQLGEDKSGKGGQGKDISIYNGSAIGALFNLKPPASIAGKMVFKRLQKQDYDHSIIKLLAIQDLPDNGDKTRAKANCFYKRMNKSGEIFESGYALYEMEKSDGVWHIMEIWLYDDINNPPTGLRLNELTAV